MTSEENFKYLAGNYRLIQAETSSKFQSTMWYVIVITSDFKS